MANVTNAFQGCHQKGLAIFRGKKAVSLAA